MAAAIVEAHAYAYIYKTVAPKAQVGSNLIAPLGISADTLGVLGTSLSTGPSGSRLMLLTEDSIMTLSM